MPRFRKYWLLCPNWVLPSEGVGILHCVWLKVLKVSTPELELGPLRELESLEQSHVPIVAPDGPTTSSWRRPPLERCRFSERRGAEPLGMRFPGK